MSHLHLGDLAASFLVSKAVMKAQQGLVRISGVKAICLHSKWTKEVRCGICRYSYKYVRAVICR
jgi:hypothetical protein